jgi:hypothetical protein
MRTTIVAIVMMAAAAPLAAHHTSTLEFALTIAGDRFDVAITCEEPILRAKVDALQQPLEQLVDVRFDGTHATAVAQGFGPAAPNESPVMHLTGTIPSGSSNMTFSTGLVWGSFPLTIVRPGRPPGIEWLQGAQVSAAYDVRERGDRRRALWPVFGLSLTIALVTYNAFSRRM